MSNDNSSGAQRSRQAPQEKAKLKRTVARVIILLIIIAGALAIWGVTSRLLARSHLEKKTTDDAQTTVVTVKPVKSDAGDELVLPGTVQAVMEAPIYARTSGYLRAWYTDIGTHVHKGQPLADIESPEVDRQLGQARADFETARVNANLAHTTDKRWQGLLITQSVSQQDADEKAGDAAAKQAAAESARQNVARLEDLESFKRVLAPFDGVITARNTDVGALINSGQSANAELFRLADTKRLRIYAQVPEAYAASTKPGLKAELHFAERPDKIYEAETVRTSNALDPTARTLQVELQLNNQNNDVFPGSYVEVHFKLPPGERTLRLPSNTVLFRSNGLEVATVNASKVIKMKQVTQGRDFGKTLEIVKGLNEDDDVVVNPSDSIEDGVTVRLAPPPCTAEKTGGKAQEGKPDASVGPASGPGSAKCASAKDSSTS